MNRVVALGKTISMTKKETSNNNADTVVVRETINIGTGHMIGIILSIFLVGFYIWDSTNNRIDKVEDRIDTMNQNINTKIDTMNQDINDRIDGIYQILQDK